MIEQTEQRGAGSPKERIRTRNFNRIDETIVFSPLTRDQIARVVRIQLIG